MVVGRSEDPSPFTDPARLRPPEDTTRARSVRDVDREIERMEPLEGERRLNVPNRLRPETGGVDVPELDEPRRERRPPLPEGVGAAKVPPCRRYCSARKVASSTMAGIGFFSASASGVGLKGWIVG